MKECTFKPQITKRSDSISRGTPMKPSQSIPVINSGEREGSKIR
jgi:hypothetical protein